MAHPDVRHLPFEGPEHGKSGGRLTVELAPAPPAKPAPPPAAPPVTAPAPPSAKRGEPPRPARPAPPPVIARAEPGAAPAPPAAAPAPPAAESDLASYIEARRKARAEATAPASEAAPPPARAQESERERHSREVAAKLGLDNSPTIGYDPRAGGGIFQIQYVAADQAEFVFFGWNRDIRRNTRQRVKVERGENPDIRIAVVRKMIAIIRENVSGDFVWVSQRLRRDVTLSARVQDNAGLEDFLMQEFFGDARLPR
ncbi:MAG: hypothetical protein N2544_05840 [Burkholderiales bacterium]|nr:hypothetical protein [Burkholderiales bacterium]